MKTVLKSKAMGFVFVGPILASAVLPLLARPSFVLQDSAGGWVFVLLTGKCHILPTFLGI